jgi:hypothetical protein
MNEAKSRSVVAGKSKAILDQLLGKNKTPLLRQTQQMLS